MSSSKDILKKLKKSYEKLENQKLSIDDIDNMVEWSKDLYERAVILRYKAFEQKVFKEKDVLPVEEKVEKSEPVNQEIDFGIFEELKEETGTEQEQKDEVVIEDTSEVEFRLDEEDSEIEVEKLDVIGKVELETAPEEVVVEETVEIPAESEEEVIEEETDAEEPAKEELVEEKTNSGGWDILIRQWVKDNEGAFVSPLDNLSSSFGLNERLMYINELFDGNSEPFGQLIDALDKKENWNQCADLIAQTAEQENWDGESEIISEFVLHIKRKHA